MCDERTSVVVPTSLSSARVLGARVLGARVHNVPN